MSRTSGRSFTVELTAPLTGHGPSRAVCSMINRTAAGRVRSTDTTRKSASRPNNTAAGSDNTPDNTWKGSVDVASVMLVASLLDVVRDQQHVGATSTPEATTRSSSQPARPR
ncbi:MAG TPA: hypothetical protein VFP34_12900 [Microlunatus sp.]|nr:hypothetical protein [Microlunatus sp.]